MNWLKAIRIGLRVLQVLRENDVRIKGVPIEIVTDVVEEAMTSGCTVRELAPRTNRLTSR